jgi:hypothetical protein
MFVTRHSPRCEWRVIYFIGMKAQAWFGGAAEG